MKYIIYTTIPSLLFSHMSNKKKTMSIKRRIDRINHRIVGKTCTVCHLWFPGSYIRRHYKNKPNHRPPPSSGGDGNKILVVSSDDGIF